jgi:hypothetical protein
MAKGGSRKSVEREMQAGTLRGQDAERECFGIDVQFCAMASLMQRPPRRAECAAGASAKSLLHRVGPDRDGC